MKDQDPDQPGARPMERESRVPSALSHGAFSAMTVLPGEDRNEFIELYNAIAAEFLPDGPVETDAVMTIAKCLWRASHLTILQRAKWARAKYGPSPTSDIPLTESARTQYLNLMDKVTRYKQRYNVHGDTLRMSNRKVINDLKYAAQLLEGTITIPAEVDLLDLPVAVVLTKEDKEILKESAANLKIDLKQLLQVANQDYELSILGDVVTEEHLEKELAILERLDARRDRAMKTLMQAKAMKEILGTDQKKRAMHAQLDTKKKV